MRHLLVTHIKAAFIAVMIRKDRNDTILEISFASISWLDDQLHSAPVSRMIGNVTSHPGHQYFERTSCRLIVTEELPVLHFVLFRVIRVGSNMREQSDVGG